MAAARIVGRLAPLVRPARLRLLHAWQRFRNTVFVQQVMLAPLEPLTHDSLFRMRFFAVALMLGEPTYYAFWRWLDPQPVENPWMRAVSMVFAAPLLFRGFHRRLGPGGMNWYWSALCLYSLPVSFFALYRANGYNDVWMGSCVAMLFCLYILTDWRLATIEVIVAIVLVRAAQPVLGAFESPPLDHYAIFALAFGTAAMLAMSDANVRFLRARAALATIGVMAHEFRTPLATADLLVDSLLREPACAAPRIQARLNKLKADFASVNAMIDYQIGSTKVMGFPTEREDVALGTIVEAAVANLPAVAAGQRSPVEVVIVRDAHVRVHPGLMRQVIHNLLTNALKSVRAKGRAAADGDVVVVLDSDRDHVRLRVSDRGVGVAAQDMLRLFEPFFSTSATPAHGLGLTMCRNAVSAFGGDIWCVSRAGQGATFHLLLPRVPQARLERTGGVPAAGGARQWRDG